MFWELRPYTSLGLEGWKDTPACWGLEGDCPRSSRARSEHLRIFLVPTCQPSDLQLGQVTCRVWKRALGSGMSPWLCGPGKITGRRASSLREACLALARASRSLRL